MKLQYGEYISLGKIEAEFKTCPFVDNICVIGNGLHDYLVALIVPNQQQLQTLAASMGKEELSIKELCYDADIVAAITKEIVEHGQKSESLLKFATNG